MKHPSENQSQEVLAGLVERVTYHNVENGFWVLGAKVRVQSTAQGAKTISTQPRIKFSPHHCALPSAPIHGVVLASSGLPESCPQNGDLPKPPFTHWQR